MKVRVSSQDGCFEAGLVDMCDNLMGVMGVCGNAETRQGDEPTTNSGVARFSPTGEDGYDRKIGAFPWHFDLSPS